MTDPDAQSDAQPDAAPAAVARPVPRPARRRARPARCMGCGYDLTGLHRSGQCPECATPISRSAEGNPLAAEPAAVLARVRLGLRLLTLATAAAPLVAGAAYEPLAPLFLGLAAVVVAIGPVAAWLITAEQGPERAARRGYRWTLRATSVLACVLALLAVLLAGPALTMHDTTIARLWPQGLDDYQRAEAAAASIVALALAPWLVAHVLTLWWLALLARRLPDAPAVQMAGLAILASVTVSVTGAVFVVVVGFILHAVAFFPLCLLIPLWMGGAIAWYAAAMALFMRLARRVGELLAATAPAPIGPATTAPAIATAAAATRPPTASPATLRW